MHDILQMQITPTAENGKKLVLPAVSFLKAVVKHHHCLLSLATSHTASRLFDILNRHQGRVKVGNRGEEAHYCYASTANKTNGTCGCL